jgi:outer membrane receptor protein involved in Fe transport
VLSDIETGYRVDLGSAATLAVTGFWGRYQHLATAEPGTPVVKVGSGGPFVFVPVHFDSLLDADTRGLEIDAHWTPTRWWRIDAAYTGFHFTPRIDPASHDPTAARYDGNASGRQWQLHSGVSVRGRADVDLALYHVGALTGIGVPAYTRADARLEMPLTRQLTVSFVGQNLFDALHAEFAEANATVFSTLVPRSARVQLAWRY